MIFKHLCVLKKAATYKFPNGTTEVVGDIKSHQFEEACVYKSTLADYSSLNFPLADSKYRLKELL